MLRFYHHIRKKNYYNKVDPNILINDLLFEWKFGNNGQGKILLEVYGATQRKLQILYIQNSKLSYLGLNGYFDKYKKLGYLLLFPYKTM